MVFLTVILYSVILFFAGAICLNKQNNRDLENHAKFTTPIVLNNKCYIIKEITIVEDKTTDRDSYKVISS